MSEFLNIHLLYSSPLDTADIRTLLERLFTTSQPLWADDSDVFRYADAATDFTWQKKSSEEIYTALENDNEWAVRARSGSVDFTLSTNMADADVIEVPRISLKSDSANFRTGNESGTTLTTDEEKITTFVDVALSIYEALPAKWAIGGSDLSASVDEPVTEAPSSFPDQCFWFNIVHDDGSLNKEELQSIPVTRIEPVTEGTLIIVYPDPFDRSAIERICEKLNEFPE